MVAAAAAAPATEPTDVAPEQKTEREVVIVDLKGGDAKVVEYTKSFTITWRNPETGEVKTGTFTAKRPTLGMLGRIAVIKAQMNGGLTIETYADNMHEMMASLQVILTAAPDWWAPHDLYDASPLRDVWDHVRSWLDSFRSGRVV